MNETNDSVEQSESTAKLVIRAVVRMGILVGLCAAAGIYGYWNAWLLLGLTIVVLAVNLIVMKLRNPGLIRERLKPDRPTKLWDRIFLAVTAMAGLGILVIAPVDFFLIHGPAMSVSLIVAGSILFVAGDAIVAWAMGENPFLERTVRIQSERHHVVITTGPYRWMRHPMYTGMLIMMVGWPLVLGSWWTFVPVLLLDVSLIVRTYFEDRALHEELPGYREYAQKTRYRLVPGVW